MAHVIFSWTLLYQLFRDRRKASLIHTPLARLEIDTHQEAWDWTWLKCLGIIACFLINRTWHFGSKNWIISEYFQLKILIWIDDLFLREFLASLLDRCFLESSRRLYEWNRIISLFLLLLQARYTYLSIYIYIAHIYITTLFYMWS